jgi:glucokinase
MGKNKKLALDVGGTNIIGALVEGNTITEREKTKTAAEKGPDAVTEKMIEIIENLLQKGKIKPTDVAGIAVAVPGQINREQGVVLYTPNIGFDNYPLVEKLEQQFDTVVLLENDVKAGTYGEYIAGAAKGYLHVVGLFPGTGIGGGIIVEGKLYRGSTGNAGEIGHMIIQTDGPLCNSGHYGCLESLASRTSMAKDAVSLAGAGKAPSTLENAGTDIKNYKSKIFKKAYKAEEKPIIHVVERAAFYLGIGMANCVNILNPEIIVVGGGLIDQLGEQYLEVAKKSMYIHALPALVKDVVVKQAVLGDDAVLLGAAGLLADQD